ncbi:hypothetical protein FBQ81_06660 [Chloroflexi bacterium CFX6]|nr:hypothetical protein [Chloroflexi bacterium CFX6]
MVTVNIRELKQEIDRSKRFAQDKKVFAGVNKIHAKIAGREWAELDSLVVEIGANWKTGKPAAKIVSEGRR